QRRARHAVPTRRSSDLDLDSGLTTNFGITATGAFGMSGDGNKLLLAIRPSAGAVLLRLFDAESGTSTDLSTNSRYASISADGKRSEEHTSELQSRENLV